MLKKLLQTTFRYPKDSNNNVQTVFIVTYGRSGSTLLQRFLNSIDGYCIRGENNDTITGLYYSYKNALYTKINWGSKPLPESHPWYGADLIEPIAFGRKLGEVLLKEIVRPEPSDRVIGFKEIRYFYHADIFNELMDFFLECFPGSRIIFNKRDAESVCKSGWWAEKESTEVFAEIARNDSLMTDYAKNKPERCFLVDYNEYSKKVNAIKPLFDFLGESFDKDKLNAILSVKLNVTPEKKEN